MIWVYLNMGEKKPFSQIFRAVVTRRAADSSSSKGSMTRPALGVASLRLRLDAAPLPSRKSLTANQPKARARDIFVWPADVTAALRGYVCFSDRVTSEHSGQTTT